ncbi:MAG: ribonuclease P protein component [Prevotella sp.]|nr:ribonuclease P protein component [Prevotella sp.]
MPEERRYTLTKQERICSRSLTEQLFNSGKAHSMVAFPLRIVYMGMERTDGTPQASILVSVSKRYFKRAVKRNRVKRQVREAYRKNKYILLDQLAAQPETQVAMAFIWLSDELCESNRVERSVRHLLEKVAESV